jgi:hypothetical protein
MRDQGIAGEAGTSAPGRSVSGLGVCDVWRLELSAEQWPWLVDELEDLRGPLEEALQLAYAERLVDRSDALVEEIAAREYELRLVRLMRAQLPAADHDGPVVFVGPADLVRELVGGTLRHLVDELGDIVDARSSGLIHTAQAAAAWARTFIDCRALEAFSFDPAADPVRMR